MGSPRHGGFANLHPLQRDDDCQGALALLYHLRVMLQEIAGLPEVCLQPCAGAHGQWTVLQMILAYFRDHGQPHAPDGARRRHRPRHQPRQLPPRGADVVTITQRRRRPDSTSTTSSATSPRRSRRGDGRPTRTRSGSSTRTSSRSSTLVHDAGAMVYLDGANINAMLGIARPGDFGVDAMHFNTHQTLGTPHGCGGPGAGPIAVSDKLAPYLPVPQVVETRRRPLRVGPTTGRSRSARSTRFCGQFNVLVRAYTYIRALRPRRPAATSRRPRCCAPTTSPQRITRRVPAPLRPAAGRADGDRPVRPRVRHRPARAARPRRDDHGHRQGPDRPRLPPADGPLAACPTA